MGKTRKRLGAVVLLSAIALTGCSSNATEPGDQKQPAEEQGQTNSEVPAGPLGKYDPPIEIMAVKGVNEAFKTKDGETWENNMWSDEYKKTLGITVKYEWATPDSQYEQKLNLSLASGKLPDMLAVNSKQLAQLIETDQIEDLSAVYEQYASEQTKELMASDGGIGMDSAKWKDKLMAIPEMLGNQTQADMLWVRTDWLKKLNLPEPKTMDDVMAIAEAFATKDPDGDGKANTYGLAMNIPGVGFVTPNGFFNAYHAYPSMWIDDGTGKLVNGSIQPETKTALAKLHEMYEKNLIDKEFSVKEGAKLGEDITSGKVGLFFGANWAPYSPLIDGVRNNPDMDWKPFSVPSVDDKPVKVQVGFPIGRYYVVKKGYAHPEAVIKLLNLFIEKINGPAEDYDTFGIDKTDGRTVRDYAFVKAYSPNDVKDYLDIKEALKSEDASKLRGYVAQRYALIKDFLATGNVENWSYARQMAPEDSAFEVLDSYADNDQYLQPGYFGAPTQTMVEKQAALDKLQNETFIKIIMGADTIDAFDKFVVNWKKIGGDEIASEVNAWKQAK